MGDLLSASSPLKGLGHFQATWAAPRAPAVRVMVIHGALPGGGLALGLACLGGTWTWRRVSQDGVAVTTPPDPDDLDPSQCQGLPAAARPRRSAGGPDPGPGDSPMALAEERGLWTPSHQP